MSKPLKKQVSPHSCDSCSSLLVQVTDWIRVDGDHWQIRTRCPECHSRQKFIMDNAQVADFSQHVEQGFCRILDSLAQLDQEDFERTCKVLIHALRSNHIYPMDF